MNDFLSTSRNGLLALLFGVASVILLRISVTQDPIWPLLLTITIGALLGALALLFAWWVIREAENLNLISVLFAGAGVVLTVVAIAITNASLAPVGLLLAMVGLLGLYERLAHSDIAGSPLIGVVGAAVLAGSVFAIAQPGPGWSAIGVVAAVLGLVALKVGALRFVRRPTADRLDAVGGRAKRATWASVVTCALGLVVLVAAPSLPAGRLHPTIEIAGAMLLVAGLSVLGIAAFHVDPGTCQAHRRADAKWWAVLLIGLALTIAGAFFVSQALPIWNGLALTLILLAVGLGAFFVFRGELIVAVVILGLALAWVLVDRTAEPERVSPATAEGTILVVGDSFASGQGSNRFVPGTNTKGDDGNSCRRSTESFGYLLGQRLNREVRNVACDGAKLEHLTEIAQGDGIEVPQLAEYQSVRGQPADLVLMVAGGNDVQFSTAVGACALPSDCTEVEAQFLAEVDLIGRELTRRIDDVREVVGNSTPIVVVPYPDYVGDKRCGLSLSHDELEFGQAFITALNEVLKFNAISAGARYFPDMGRAYLDRPLCADEPAANMARLVPYEGSIVDRLNPAGWFQASMHPNDLGHRCVAAALDEWLRGSPRFESAASVGTVPDCELAGEVTLWEPEPTLPDRPPTADASLFCTISSADPAPDGTCAGRDLAAQLDDIDDLDRTCIDGGEPTTLSPICVEGDRCVAGVGDAIDRDGCLHEDAWAADQYKATVAKLSWPIAVTMVGALLVALGFARLAPQLSPLLPFLPDPPLASGMTRAEARGPRRGIDVLRRRPVTDPVPAED